MRRNTEFLVLALLAASALAVGQMRPGQTGQPGMQQPGMPPGMQQPGMPPGMPGPGMGQPGQQPGMGQEQTAPQQRQPKVDDATLLRQVHEQLVSRGEFANVKATVKNGVVHLEGSVPRKGDRKEIRNRIKSIPGVQGVKEKLAINPSSGAAATSTTGAENTSQFGASGGATSTSPTGANAGSPTAAQNPASPLANSPSERGSAASNSSALGQSPSTSSMSGTPAPGAAGATGAATSAPSGTQTGAPAGAMGNVGAQTGAPTQPSSQPSTNQPSAQAGSFSTPPGADLAGQIQTAMHQDPALSNVVANVTDSEIVLSGTVANGKAKQSAKRIAESFASNRKVVDKITVSGRGRNESNNPPSPY